MIKPEYRLYHIDQHRMYNFVKGYEQSFGAREIVWTVWDDNSEDRCDWKEVRIADNLVDKQPFIGIYDDTAWNKLAEWDKLIWTNKGYSESDWEGKPIFVGDIARFVCDGVREKLEVIKLHHLALLRDCDDCVKDIPYDRRRCKLYILGNVKQNPNLIDDQNWKPINQ